jgi:hypothetical protein
MVVGVGGTYKALTFEERWVISRWEWEWEEGGKGEGTGSQTGSARLTSVTNDLKLGFRDWCWPLKV